MSFRPPTPPQCEIIFRQDLLPTDTILPLQSQQLLITLAPNTPSELQPIVIAARQESSSYHHATRTAMEPIDPFFTEATPTSARRASIFDYSTAGRGYAAIGSKELDARKTLEPEPKTQPRGDRIRRSRRQQK